MMRVMMRAPAGGAGGFFYHVLDISLKNNMQKKMVLRTLLYCKQERERAVHRDKKKRGRGRSDPLTIAAHIPYIGI